MSIRLIITLCFALLFLNPNNSSGQENESESKKVCKVFLLAGQSNMVGHGVVDLDHADHYNGGKGNLNSLFDNEKKRQLVSHLRTAEGNWNNRNDVYVRFQSRVGLKVGKLSVGFTGYEGQNHFGPELQFGHIVGDNFDEPVLLLKAAWGGKSLLEDFASPSSGNTGEYYTKMLSEFREGLENIETELPELANHDFEIAGFVWMQGWNDMCNEEATKKYSTNLIHFINDVRKELEIPNLPFVVGELGNDGKAKRNTAMHRFRVQQQKACVHPPFVGNVSFVPTVEYARPAEDSPNTTHAHHWYGNAESYFLVGDGLGKQMVRLIAAQSQPRVLILGDSISMGYTPHVRSMLPESFVWRPMKTARQGENCQGTNHGIRRIDDWIDVGEKPWDVIHFNFGLHDLKHVDPDTNKNSTDPEHPQQASPEIYAKQLEEITLKLKATGAKLIFATTTPVPEGGVKPYRAIEAPSKYNAIATEIMQRHGVEVNDLYATVKGREAELMRPVDVHFKPEGSKILARQVADAIKEALGRTPQAAEIIRRMAEAYSTCKTYQDKGTVTTVFSSARGEQKVVKEFSTAMDGADRFRFEYTENGKANSRYLIWQNGKDVRTWWELTQASENPVSLEMALAAATGVSNGTAHTIPSLLRPNEIGGRRLTDIEHPERGDDKTLDNHKCFTIDAEFLGRPVTVWIDQETFLVRRIDETSEFDDFSTEETTIYDPVVNKQVSSADLKYDAPE